MARLSETRRDSSSFNLVSIELRHLYRSAGCTITAYSSEPRSYVDPFSVIPLSYSERCLRKAEVALLLANESGMSTDLRSVTATEQINHQVPLGEFQTMTVYLPIVLRFSCTKICGEAKMDGIRF